MGDLKVGIGTGEVAASAVRADMVSIPELGVEPGYLSKPMGYAALAASVPANPFRGLLSVEGSEEGEAIQGADEHDGMDAATIPDIGLLIALGLGGVVGAILALAARNSRRWYRNHVRSIAETNLDTITRHTPLGMEWLAKSASLSIKAVGRAEETFSKGLISLISDISLVLAFDRRAVTKVGRLSPSILLSTYWREARRKNYRRLKDTAVDVYREHFARAAWVHAKIAGSILGAGAEVGRGDPGGAVIKALHYIAAAQLEAQEGQVYDAPDLRARHFESAYGYASGADDLLNARALRDDLEALEPFGLDAIRRESRALISDIDAAHRDTFVDGQAGGGGGARRIFETPTSETGLGMRGGAAMSALGASRLFPGIMPQLAPRPV